MVSYRQLDQHGIQQVVLHERETGSSGRPKATHGIEEDVNYFYTYTRTGGVEKTAKTEFDKYWDFLQHQVIYRNFDKYRSGEAVGTMHQVSNNVSDNIIRDTPPTDYEIALGYGKFNPFIKGEQLDKQKTKQKTKILSTEHFRKLQEAEDKARKLAEEQRLAKLRESARPKPREVEKPEPVEIEPIKEAVKYSPLMIAGVIAVVVILLLRRKN